MRAKYVKKFPLGESYSSYMENTTSVSPTEINICFGVVVQNVKSPHVRPPPRLLRSYRGNRYPHSGGLPHENLLGNHTKDSILNLTAF